MINQLNLYYSQNPGPNGTSGYGCDNNGGSIDMCGVCRAVGETHCTPDPQPTDCAGPGSTWTDCGCIGGTSGFADCDAKNCDKFLKWIREHQNNDTTSDYYDRTDNRKAANGVCTEGIAPACDISFRYWNYKGAEKYYFHNGNWLLYNNCDNACYEVDLDKTRSLTDFPFNGNTLWCVYYSLAALSGTEPCEIAQYYYLNIMRIGSQPCTNNTPCFISQQAELFGHYGYTLTLNNTINTECKVIKLFMDGKKGIVDNITDHTSIVYGVHRNKQGIVTLDMFDTRIQPWIKQGMPFNNYSPGGTDYEIQ